MKIGIEEKDLRSKQKKGVKALISKVVFFAMKLPGVKFYGPGELDDMTPRKRRGETEMKDSGSSQRTTGTKERRHPERRVHRQGKTSG